MERPVAQIFALLFMCIAIMLIVISTRDGRLELAAVNTLLFGINAWVFVKTCRMRDPEPRSR